MRGTIPVQMKVTRMNANVIQDGAHPMSPTIDIQMTVKEIQADATKGKRDLIAKNNQDGTQEEEKIKSVMMLNLKGRWGSSLTRILNALER